jgi:maltose alpha-D-glucosyltransferase / alpha-amylase
VSPPLSLCDRPPPPPPMQWTGGWNGGFSNADPERLNAPLISNPVYGYQAVNVEAQKRSPHSLLLWMKRLLEIRKSTQAFSRGSLEFLRPSNRRVLPYIRVLGDETILAVNNLSSSAQAVELNLQKYEGLVPEEMAGRNLFPRITENPYLMTLGPYQSFWFHLRRV